jgi:GNAT superfamily N-acetyltransferase
MTEEGRTIEVTRTYLEMTAHEGSTAADIPDPSPGERVRIDRNTECPASFYRYLYREVGRYYHWIDRLGWTDQEILAHLANPNLSLWTMYVEGSPAGFFELLKYEDGSTEVAYFGLLPEFIGRGLGKQLLNEAIARAWQTNPTRVWLHTCTLDDPVALPNYLKRGFIPFKQETYFTTIAPDEELRS